MEGVKKSLLPVHFTSLDYDTLKSEQSQFGASAFSGKIKNYVRPIVLKRAEFEGWKDIRFSMWMFNAGFSRTQQEVFAEGIDAEGGTQRIAGGSVMRSRNIWGDWSFVEIEGEIKPEYEQDSLSYKGKSMEPIELLFRQSSCEAYQCVCANARI